MTADEITWVEALHPVPDGAIEEIEHKLGRRFPDDYRSFLRKYQGGTPAETDFDLNDPRKRNVAVGTFLSVLPDTGSDYILQALELLRDRLPSGLVPIAVGPGGDYVMLDYRNGAPTVVYWHHERSGDPDEFTNVALTFTKFVDLLFEPDLDAGSELD